MSKYLLVCSDDNNNKSVADESNEDDDTEDNGHYDGQKSLHGIEVTVIGSDVAYTGTLVAQRQLSILRQIAQRVAAHDLRTDRIVEPIEEALARDDALNHVHCLLTVVIHYGYSSGIQLLPTKRAGTVVTSDVLKLKEETKR